MADFALGAATWRTAPNILVVVDYSPFASLCENVTLSTNRKYVTYCTAVRENRATATGNMYRKLFGEIWD